MNIQDSIRQVAAEAVTDVEDEYSKLRAKVKSRAQRGKIGRALLWIISHGKMLTTIALVAFLTAWAWHWYSQAPDAPVGVSMPAVVAWEVQQEAKTGADVKNGQVQVFKNRSKVMDRLNLPESVKNNPAKEVVAAAKIEPDGFARGHTVTAILDKETGEVKLLDRADSLPWLRWRTDGLVFVGPGFINGDIGARAMVVQHLASVGPATLSAVGSLDQPMASTTVANNHGLNTFVGVGLTIPFKW